MKSIITKENAKVILEKYYSKERDSLIESVYEHFKNCGYSREEIRIVVDVEIYNDIIHSWRWVVKGYNPSRDEFVVKGTGYSLITGVNEKKEWNDMISKLAEEEKNMLMSMIYDDYVKGKLTVRKF